MKFEKTNDGKIMNVELIGEIDSMNVTEIEETLLREAEGVTDITFDLSQLEYISSAGLRMLLQMQKMMKTQGNMTIKNVNEEVMEIFKVTGFVRLLNIV
jgi:anti-sigma B factor antagonist